MQTTLTRIEALIRTAACSLAALAFAVAGSSAGAASASASVPFDETTRLVLVKRGAVVSAQLAGRTTKVMGMDPALRSAIAGADEYFVVGRKPVHDGERVFVLIVTVTPSRAGRPTGFCGAGTEDALRLIEVDGRHRRLTQVSSMLLQSCTKNFALGDDTGTTLRSRLEDATDPGHIALTWLDHPVLGSGPRTIVIQGQSLVAR